MKNLIKLVYILSIIFGGIFVLIRCHKKPINKPMEESNVSKTENASKTPRFSWSYGEPIWYDDLGFPRWNPNYPKVKILNLAEEHIRYIYYYTDSDISLIKQTIPIGGCVDKYLDPSNPRVECSPRCIKRATQVTGAPYCNCKYLPVVDLTPKKAKQRIVSIVLFNIGDANED